MVVVGLRLQLELEGWQVASQIGLHGEVGVTRMKVEMVNVNPGFFDQRGTNLVGNPIKNLGPS